MKPGKWSILGLWFILPLCVACTKTEPSQPTSTHLTSTIPTAQPPTAQIVTGGPTQISAAPTPTANLMPAEIPECVPDGSGGEFVLSDALQKLIEGMQGWDSYRFKTTYEYLLTGNYSSEDLSAQVEGEYSGLQNEPLKSILEYSVPSQKYSRSRVIYNDLRSGQQSEIISTPAGVWYRSPGGSNWIAIGGSEEPDRIQLSEVLSPESIIKLFNFPNFEKGIQARTPVLQKQESISGKTVMHRCWRISDQQMIPDAFLLQGNFIYTFLTNSSVQLWTSNNDTELVRLVITGSHTGEGYYDDGVDMHESPSQFMVWVETDNINQPVNIAQPPESAIVASLSNSIIAQNTPSNSPFNDFPLPGDVSTEIPSTPQKAPAEFFIYDMYIKSDRMSQFLGSAWNNLMAERTPQYITSLTIEDLTNFYLKQMSMRGWGFSGKFLEEGFTRLYLFFERETVTTAVILTTLAEGNTLVQAYLPPRDEVVKAVLNNWQFYDKTDNPFLGEDINDIAIDSQGQAWIGTQSGILKYDGKIWAYITAEGMGLGQARIKSVAVDQADTVWVGSSDGVAHYNGMTWSTFNLNSSGDPLEWVQTIFISPNGDVWIGQTKEISVYDGKEWITYTNENGGPATVHEINTIAMDLNGNIWIGTSGGGVFVREDGKWRTAIKETSPPNTYMMGNNVQKIIIDQNGWVWVATEGKLQVFDGTNWYVYEKPVVNFLISNVYDQSAGDFPFSDVYQVATDKYNRIWVGSHYYGLALQEENSNWTLYSPLILPTDSFSLNSMTIDAQGRIWIGTDAGFGVFTTPPTSSVMGRTPLPSPLPPAPNEPLEEAKPGWTSYALEDTPLSTEISSITVDAQNRIWLAGNGAIAIDSNGEWIHYSVENTPVSGLLSNRVKNLAADELNRVWMATDNGLAMVDGSGKWNNFTPETSNIPFRNIKEVEIDSQGYLWALSESYSSSDVSTMSMMNTDGTWVTYPADTLFKSEDNSMVTIRTIEADHQSRMWIASYYSLTVLSRDGSQETYSVNDLGLETDKYEMVNTLYADREDRIWIGTSRGKVIILSSSGETVRYDLSSIGLPGGGINAIIIDENGRAWIGSDYGLNLLNGDGTWTTYKSTRVALPDVHITSLAIDQLGRVWVGTQEGPEVFIWPLPE